MLCVFKKKKNIETHEVVRHLGLFFISSFNNKDKYKLGQKQTNYKTRTTQTAIQSLGKHFNIYKHEFTDRES